MRKSLGSYFKQLTKLVGRKGLILLSVSLYLIYLGFQMTGAEPGFAAQANLMVPLTILPLSVWGSILTITGTIGMIGVFWKPMRILGHNVLAGTYYLWGGFYAVSWITDLVTAGHMTYGAGPKALFLLGVAALMTIIAGWKEN